MKKRINYVLAAWSGARDSNQPGGYIKDHLGFLSRCRHHIDQITIGHPINDEESEEYRQSLEAAKASHTPTVIMDQPNLGRSYGQWSRAFDQYRDSFDYYIFIEDDYVPWIDNFDDILIEEYEKKKAKNNCGFLCGLFAKDNEYGFLQCRPHAAVANGICSSDVLQRVWDKFGMLPHDTDVAYHDGQNLFSKGFLKCGYKICDHLSDDVRTLYYAHDTSVLRWYSKTGLEKKDIIVPIQFAQQPAGWKYVLYTPTNNPDPKALLNPDVLRVPPPPRRKLIATGFSP